MIKQSACLRDLDRGCAENAFMPEKSLGVGLMKFSLPKRLISNICSTFDPLLLRFSSLFLFLFCPQLGYQSISEQIDAILGVLRTELIRITSTSGLTKENRRKIVFINATNKRTKIPDRGKHVWQKWFQTVTPFDVYTTLMLLATRRRQVGLLSTSDRNCA